MLTHVPPYPHDSQKTNEGSTGMFSSAWVANTARFDSRRLLALAAGTRRPYGDTQIPTWSTPFTTLWPTIPLPQNRATSCGKSTCMVVDMTARQLIWLQARSYRDGYGVMPTFQVFTLPA